MTTTNQTRARGPRRHGGPVATVLSWLYALVLAAPLYYLAVSALKTNIEIFTRPFALPAHWLWENFATAWETADLGHALLNSLLISVIAIVLTLGLALPAAYALARQDNRLSRAVTATFSAGFLIPPFAALIPAVILAIKMGLFYTREFQMLRIHIITGDYGLTAAEIARQVGIGHEGRRVIAGDELDRLSDADLDAMLADGDEIVFARVSPEAKLRICEALRAQGQTVAMTGDGVNDAPALGREPAEPGLMDRPPRPRTAGVIDRALLVRAWGLLGGVSAVLVMADSSTRCGAPAGTSVTQPAPVPPCTTLTCRPPRSRPPGSSPARSVPRSPPAPTVPHCSPSGCTPTRSCCGASPSNYSSPPPSSTPNRCNTSSAPPHSTPPNWSSSPRSRSSSGAPTNSSAGHAATARRPSKTD